MWTECSKTCGYGGKSRQREITQENERSGTPCPHLMETKLCGSMRTCNWSYFKFGRTEITTEQPQTDSTVASQET